MFRSKLFLLSGLLTVGVGDSCAAIGGLSVSRPWRVRRSNNKSVQGLFSFVFSVLLAIHLFAELCWTSFLATLLAAVAESVTKKHDNIVPPTVFALVVTLFSSNSV